MQVAVVGGTGSVGAPLVEELIRRGDEVRVLSRSSREVPIGASHHRVDIGTGEGLTEALHGVEAVVDAANSSRKPAAVLVEGSRRLLAVEAELGVRHHVGISIVGCDRVPLGYYRKKIAQEAVIADAPIGWSLLRASQFHTLLAMVFELWSRVRAVPTGSARFQPIAPEIVGKRLADAVHDGPGGRLPDITGPEVKTLSELAQAWRVQSAKALLPVGLPMIGKLGRALREGRLCDPAAAAGGPTFEEWLSTR